MGDELVGVFLEDCPFCTCWIILGQVADLLE
jgi:hypothetical protein